MTLKYLITGATGGLGKHVLGHFIENVPLSEFAAASSKSSNKAIFEDRGIAFRHVDYDDTESLDTRLRDVENLLFLSSSSKERIGQHINLINAAKKAGVKHVWYTSLAFGGFENNSRSPIQAEHVLTEKLLKDALQTNPNTELGEATARIMVRGGYENQIVLFTSEETITAQETVHVINETTNRQIKFQSVSREEYIRASLVRDASGKSQQHFEIIAGIWDDINDGALCTTHPLMHEILGREPTKPQDALKQLLTENRDFRYP
ncbi:NAD(P)-binding protein [Aaosphaeria arxii CBS 175.79]|uniref:NAD(P)-binding protein n=1 Tax=Aaosphaeria arxii CBS 175.79 TaxID=1450172 RepID=A0A6A5Y1C7_9PLEO|nr:NAD(P)-binding protein [Aaosphaeria arxii CBS 175.79]KAF2019056.1 NAD(P)-binding protein [Aaosphaeria arxii CBS 175.79]